jgi:oxygen-independent coproporphyrinogen-3 oxidase
VTRASEADDLGVYVHVPFCERVCPYCDFAVEAVGPGRLDRGAGRAYVGRLLRELELWLEREPALAQRRLATVYLGGGTPSLLEPSEIERLLAALGRSFPGEPEEVTLELNPGQHQAGRAAELRAAGVTRVSLGVQALQDETLRRLGRAHRACDARAGLERCLDAGFDTLSVDLIFGAPRQKVSELLADLDWLLDRGVPHVSAYALTLEPGTPFGRAEARTPGRLRLPGEDVQLAMWGALRARLAAAGLEQYEISSFARPGHRSRHNQRYWARREYLGLGVSAASQLGDRRLHNLASRADWERELDSGRLAEAECETLSERDVRRETLYLGLRQLDGVRRGAWLRRFGAPPEHDFPMEIAELRALGLVTDAAGALRLTERGILFADEVFLRFVAS